MVDLYANVDSHLKLVHSFFLNLMKFREFINPHMKKACKIITSSSGGKRTLQIFIQGISLLKSFHCHCYFL